MYSGFVYEWTNLINGKKYIGAHRGTIDDGYKGSGKIFKNALRKHGIQNFSREILFYVFDADKIKEIESHYLETLNCASDERYYNLVTNFQYANKKFKVFEKEALRKRMIDNNPNRDGIARNKYIKKYGVPIHRRYRLSDAGKAKIQDNMINRNPNKNVLPWDAKSSTPQSLIVWKDANKYYDWWVQNKKGYYAMATHFGYKTFSMSHVNLVKRFKTGWIPYKDSNWLKFKEIYED